MILLYIAATLATLLVPAAADMQQTLRSNGGWLETL